MGDPDDKVLISFLPAPPGCPPALGPDGTTCRGSVKELIAPPRRGTHRTRLEEMPILPGYFADYRETEASFCCGVWPKLPFPLFSPLCPLAPGGLGKALPVLAPFQEGPLASLALVVSPGFPAEVFVPKQDFQDNLHSEGTVGPTFTVPVTSCPSECGTWCPQSQAAELACRSPSP